MPDNNSSSSCSSGAGSGGSCDASNPTGASDSTYQIGSNPAAAAIGQAMTNFGNAVNGGFGLPNSLLPVSGLGGLPPYWYTVRPTPMDLVAANLGGDFSNFGILSAVLARDPSAGMATGGQLTQGGGQPSTMI